MHFTPGRRPAPTVGSAGRESPDRLFLRDAVFPTVPATYCAVEETLIISKVSLKLLKDICTTQHPRKLKALTMQQIQSCL